jgi:amidase
MAATACLPWLIDWVNGDNRRGTSTAPSAVAGYPNMSVPAGSLYGLPLNVSFMGLPWHEPTLIAIAAGFEHVMQARPVPQFKATADFTIDPRPCLPIDLGPREAGLASW